MLHQVICGLFISLLFPVELNFKRNRYNTSYFSPKQNYPQNTGSAGDELASCNKKFFGIIHINLVSYIYTTLW